MTETENLLSDLLNKGENKAIELGLLGIFHWFLSQPFLLCDCLLFLSIHDLAGAGGGIKAWMVCASDISNFNI